MLFNISILGLLFLLIIGSILLYRKLQSPKINLDILFGNPEKTNVQLAPDGLTIAYLADYNGAKTLFIQPIGNKKPHPIILGENKITSFTWTYNHSYLLFIQNTIDKNSHIFRLDFTTNTVDDLTPYDNIQPQFISTCEKFPDHILVKINKNNPTTFDVYDLNIITGELTLKEATTKNIIQWISDNTFELKAAVEQHNDSSATLLIKDNHNDWSPYIHWNLEDAQLSKPLHFSLDGQTLYLYDSTDLNTKTLVSLDLQSNKKTIIANDPIYDVCNIHFDKKTAKPIYVAFEKERIEWQAIQPNTKQQLQTLLDINPQGDLIAIQTSNDGQKFLLTFTEDTKPTSYYWYDIESEKTVFLLYDQPKIATYALAPMQPIAYKARDGQIIHGYLTLPHHKKSNVPLILNVHSGPWSRNTWGFDPKAQWFANRGYACLQINFRGSTGYGKEFLNKGNKEWGGIMHNDLIDAVQWAIEQGIADPENIAIYGHSYGGYAALMGAIMSPNIFRCALCFAPPTDLLALVTNPHASEAETIEDHMRVGNPKTDTELLQDRSPINHVDRITVPLCIAQGDKDTVVLPEVTAQFIKKLKVHNALYEYLEFPDEGHRLSHLENRIRFYSAAEAFLKKHLQ